MKSIKLYPLKKSVKKEITIPGCIGYTIRALNIAAMTKGSVKILNPLKSDDISSMINALKEIGIEIEEEKESLIVHGDITDVKDGEYSIDIGLSGRTARTMLALLSVVPGVKLVACSEAFKKRPVADLVDGLRQLGANIEYLEKNGYLPVKINSCSLKPGSIRMNGTLSSQYFSAIMMVSPLIGAVKIIVNGSQASKPFIDMTIGIMQNFGVTVKNNNYQLYEINNSQKYINPGEYQIEPEATSASYFFAIAAITKGAIRINNLDPKSLQGDMKFVDVLEKMGNIVKKNTLEKWIEVQGTDKLIGNIFDMNSTPDLVPTLSVVAAFAKGATNITNIAHAKLKETDRIESTKVELQKMGINVKSSKDSITITGGSPKGSRIETYDDHRLAMSFAVAGSKLSGIMINNPNVVNKSFPEFWEKLEELGINIERSDS